MREKPEFELIADCKRGDSEAITELFGRHYPESLRLARRILRSEEESQDAVQSAYFSAFRHLHSFRGEATFKTWMTRLVINQCRMVLRKPARRMSWISLDDPDMFGGSIQLVSSTVTPERMTMSMEIGSALSEAIARLPGPMREIFMLCAVSGFSVKEAAASLGLTRAAAKTRLFRAHVRMRSTLRPFRPKPRAMAA